MQIGQRLNQRRRRRSCSMDFIQRVVGGLSQFGDRGGQLTRGRAHRSPRAGGRRSSSNLRVLITSSPMCTFEFDRLPRPLSSRGRDGLA
jgi:hypothetical protein